MNHWNSILRSWWDYLTRRYPTVRRSRITRTKFIIILITVFVIHDRWICATGVIFVQLVVRVLQFLRNLFLIIVSSPLHQRCLTIIVSVRLPTVVLQFLRYSFISTPIYPIHQWCFTVFISIGLPTFVIQFLWSRFVRTSYNPPH